MEVFNKQYSYKNAISLTIKVVASVFVVMSNALEFTRFSRTKHRNRSSDTLAGNAASPCNKQGLIFVNTENNKT